MASIDRVLAVDGGIHAGPPPDDEEMFDALERVNPFTPTQLVISEQLWAIVGPEYDRLGRTLASGNRHQKRDAWKRWRAFIARARQSIVTNDPAPESA